jgi:hypothetical protein
MPTQDSPARAGQEQAQEEQAIVRAVGRYFEKRPSRPDSTADAAEISIINALHRYFTKT